MRPYGYEDDRVTIRPVEAKALRDVAERVAAGLSIQAAADHLNERRLFTTTGRAWHPIVLRRALTSRRVVGMRRVDGADVKAPWPPILTRTLQRKVARQIAASPNRRHQKPRPYLLTGGLVACGLCGSPLEARPSGEARSYTCPPRAVADRPAGCGRVRMNADSLEAIVGAKILARLAMPRSAAAIAQALRDEDARAGRLDGETRQLADRMLQVTDDWAEGRLSRDEFYQARNRIRELQADNLGARERAGLLIGVPVYDPDELARWWQRADRARRRALVTLLTHRVEVHRATLWGSHKPDPDRVKIVWR